MQGDDVDTGEEPQMNTETNSSVENDIKPEPHSAEPLDIGVTAPTNEDDTTPTEEALAAAYAAVRMWRAPSATTPMDLSLQL